MNHTQFYIKLTETGILIFLSLLNDIKTYKIKNIIVLPFILVGIITNLYFYHLNGFFISLSGILIPAVFLIPLYCLKMFGAGDVKLFSAIGSIMGLEFTLKTMAASFLAGGFIALLIMFIRKNLLQRFSYFYQFLKHCFLTLSFHPYLNAASVDSNKDPNTKINNKNSYKDFSPNGKILSKKPHGNDTSKFPFTIAVACGFIIMCFFIRLSNFDMI